MVQLNNMTAALLIATALALVGSTLGCLPGGGACYPGNEFCGVRRVALTAVHACCCMPCEHSARLGLSRRTSLASLARLAGACARGGRARRLFGLVHDLVHSLLHDLPRALYIPSSCKPRPAVVATNSNLFWLLGVVSLFLFAHRTAVPTRSRSRTHPPTT